MATLETERTVDPARRLREILESFTRAPGVRGAVLADRKGLPVASSFRSRVDVGIASAMAALTVHVSTEVFKNFGFVSFRCSVMEGEEGMVLACLLRGGLISVIAVLDSSANLGLVKIGINKLEDDVLEVLRTGAF